MSKYTKVIHLPHPDKSSLYAMACGNPISVYGFDLSTDIDVVNCARCINKHLKSFKGKSKKDKRTSSVRMMKELMLQAKAGK